MREVNDPTVTDDVTLSACYLQDKVKDITSQGEEWKIT